MAYAADPATSGEERLRAYTEVEKIDKAERQREYENLAKTTRDRSETEARKSNAVRWVTNTFPDTVIKDAAGNIIDWNNQNPLYARANEYMNRSQSLRNDPEGFQAAVKMAAFDLGVAMGSNKKLNKTVGQLRKEQKKQLASAGGTRIAESPEKISKTRLAKLQSDYAKTGNKDLFAEILKLRGMNPYAK